MPKAKTSAAAEKTPDVCILKMGRQNNIIQWRDEMYGILTTKYGATGSFLMTNVAYVNPMPHERDYNPYYVEPTEQGNSDDGYYTDDEEEGAAEADAPGTPAPAAQAPEPLITPALLAKLMEGAFDSRRKLILQQRLDLKTSFSLLVGYLSPESLAKLKEEPDWEETYLSLDTITLWGYIRRSHLTHIYANDDEMSTLNIHDQSLRYNSLRQGDRELISAFKTRFDNQVKSNQGVGIPEISEALRAMDFIGKLDPKRYNSMITCMRNSAARNLPGSYPKTLAGAYRTASTWTRDGVIVPLGSDTHSAFLSDSVFVTKSKDSKEKDPSKDSKDSKVPGDKKDKFKKSSLSTLMCFVCGKFGHGARDCSQRKTAESALLSGKLSDDEDEGAKEDVFLGEEASFIAGEETVLLSSDDVVFDTGATVSFFKNSALLTGIEKSKRQIHVNGVQADAGGVKVDQEGSFIDIGKVYYSRNASANILSMSALVDAGAEIHYDQKENSFSLTPANSQNTYHFSRRDAPGSEGRFYVCSARSMMRSEHVMIDTVEENLKRYTKREIESASRARKLLGVMGYPSVEMAIAMLRDGSGFDVSEYDFRVADAIWGKDIASIKGKTTKKTTVPANMIISAPVVQQQQILSVDIMFVDQVASVVAVSYPLELTFGVILDRSSLGKPLRTAEAVKKCIDIMITTLASRNFKVSVIMTDGEGAISKLKTYLNNLGMEVDTSGAGGHVARIERRIRTIKERLRSHICGRIPFVMNILILSYLILFVISRLNMEHTSSRPGGITPREGFSGQRVAANKDFRAAFGDYVQCTQPYPDKSMNPRTLDGIVLLPTYNRTGSHKILSLATGKIITRDNFKILPMPQSVIQYLNDMAKRDGRIANASSMITDLTYNQSVNQANMPRFISVNPPSRIVDPATQIPDNPPPAVAPLVLVDLPPPVPYNEPAEPQIISHDEGGNVQIGGVQRGLAVQDDQEQQIELPLGEEHQPVEPGDGDTHTPGEPDEQELDLPEEYEVPAGIPTNTHTPTLPPAANKRDVMGYFRGSTGVLTATDTDLIKKRVTLSAVATITAVLAKKKMESDVVPSANVSVRDALRTRGEDARTVIIKELKQMIDKKVWSPIKSSALTHSEASKVILSSMFLKMKTNPNGSFNKYKARLVAGGHRQEKTLYDDLSSPTVFTSGVFTVISIAAHERRHAAVVDIGGAFLHADMTTGVPVHMRLDKTMSDFLVALDIRYKGYQNDKGTITVHLKKALYGCVESAALWYENLSKTMKSLGYVRNEVDICIFNKLNDKRQQCTVCVHVDDLLITSVSKSMIDELTAGLEKRYGEISLTHGTVLDYLGMSIDFTTSGEARLTMAGYVQEIITTSGVTGTAATPATDGLFEMRGNAAAVSEAVRVWFHRVVAQLLYLAKRIRPECLTAVAYLSTRVTKCDEDDVEKLYRLVRYVRGTSDVGVVMRPGVLGITVRLYVDASYGVHTDGKSHTGSCIVIGDVGAVHCRSTKQAIVTKSSTEAELVGMSDSANQALHIRNFLIRQGYAMEPVTVYQDNLSCMALIARGRSGAERTRHISIRYFWTKERVDKREMIVVHKGTKEMYANVLTKPLQGGQFTYERDSLTGWAEPVRAEK